MFWLVLEQVLSTQVVQTEGSEVLDSKEVLPRSEMQEKEISYHIPLPVAECCLSSHLL